MIPTDWNHRQLQELADVERGKFSARPRNQPQFFGGSTPFVQTGDVVKANVLLTEYSQTLSSEGLSFSRTFPKETLLFTIAANIGDTALTTFEVACPDSVVGMRAKAGTCIRWLNYALQYRKPDLERLAPQNAQANLSLEKLRPFTILTPPVPEQKKIAAILSVWDRAIELTKKLIAAKQKRKDALTQQLLAGKVRFGMTDPQYQRIAVGEVVDKVATGIEVEATATYREIGIRSHGKGIFHKEPVLGSVLGDKRVYKVEPGCLTVNIVFAWEQAIAVTTTAETGFIASHRFPMFKPDLSRAEPKYLLNYFLSPKGTESLELASPGGAGRNRTLGQSAFLKTKIPLPSIHFQRRFVSLVDNLDLELSLLIKKRDALWRQKTGLMQRLLTGKVRVKNAESSGG